MGILLEIEVNSLYRLAKKRSKFTYKWHVRMICISSFTSNKVCQSISSLTCDNIVKQ